MSRLLFSTLSVGAAIALFTTVTDAGDPPAKKKALPYYCPVAGLPAAKACGCPSGYCGLKPDAKFTADYKGLKIQLCCPACVGLFKKAPEKYAAVANHQLVATGQAGQFACGNCGGGLYTGGQTTVDVAGVPVIFCKPECAKRIKDASPKDGVEMVFGEKAFVRSFGWKGQK